MFKKTNNIPTISKEVNMMAAKKKGKKSKKRR